MATAGRETSALGVVQAQLNYYNARDLDGFMSILHPDVLALDGWTGNVIAKSAADLRPRYVERFKTPVHCELIGRLALGNVVVDREIISGLPDGKKAECMAMYHVDGGLITKMQLFWKNID